MASNKDGSIKISQDHWFPKALISHWVNREGWLTQLEPAGKTTFIGRKPKSSGAIHGGHIIVKDPPWACTVEDDFVGVDDEIHNVVNHLTQIQENLFMPETRQLSPTTEPIYVTDEFEGRLASLIASLMVRSPRFRNSIGQIIKDFRSPDNQIGRADPIIAANIHSSFKPLCEALSRTRQVFLLYSDKREFVFGDGFFANNTPAQRGFPTVLLPLTPQLAIATYRSRGAYRRGHYVMKLNPSEVDEINHATQVYSGRYLFYRNQTPPIHEVFTRGEFLEFEFHSFPLLEEVAERLNGSVESRIVF